MKIAYLFATISLALSVSAAATFQDDHRDGRFNHNHDRLGQGNNDNNNGSNSTSTSTAAATSSTGSASDATSTSVSSTGGASNATSTSISSTGGASNATSTSVSSTGSALNSASTATGTAAGGNNEQSSTTLDPKVIATGFENDGQNVPTAGQVASLTSSNNFINFCLTVPNLPITNGKQIATSSCNPAPMGVIPSSDNMPSAKFTFPKNGDTSLIENTPFTISMAIQNFESGNFVNADENYFAAPQQVNAQGQIIGHSHVVVESLSALDQTTPTNPKVFAFFKGLNAAAVNGILTADVTAGLPAGFYKLSSINTAANHQPVLVPIAQHGSLDDAVYFTVQASGGGAASPAPATSAAGAVTSAVTPVASPVPPTSAAPTAGQPGHKGAKPGRRFLSRAHL